MDESNNKFGSNVSRDIRRHDQFPKGGQLLVRIQVRKLLLGQGTASKLHPAKFTADLQRLIVPAQRDEKFQVEIDIIVVNIVRELLKGGTEAFGSLFKILFLMKKLGQKLRCLD